ncbi:hypothetical protein F4212_03475 [Candidatus Poribacteria bacterium]|nr:hypothetical protein [Candidatus Poribacteria bacterium]
MKSTDKYVLVLVASLALLLAGCGGGSSSTPTTPTTPPVNPGPTPSDQLATANKIIMLHEEASGATADAEAAGMAAAQAVKDATKYSGMLGVASVMGDSTKAMMNAQMVLDARAAVTQAVMDAEAAKMRAMDAKAEAEALADDTSGKSEVIVALAAAIKAAEAELVTVTAISTGSNADDTNNKDGQALKTAVEAVTGTATKLKTPDDKAGEVAMAVAGALVPMVPNTVADTATHDGTARRVTPYVTMTAVNNATPPAVSERTSHGTNSLGRTWAMIVGEDNVMKARLGAITSGDLVSGNTHLSVASIAGMKASAVDKTSTAVLSATGGDGNGKYDDAASPGVASATGTPGTEYRGIPGVVVCLGGSAGCSVGADGTLSDGWYFSPSNAMTYYILNPTAANRNEKLYVPDTDYVAFGHWLAPDTTDDTLTHIHTYAYPAGNIANLRLGEDAGEDAVNTATYTGEAVGMSVHKTFDGNGKRTGMHSGAFTADVSLTAKFGTTPMLSGTVNNFQGGAHTDSGWSVALQETNLDSTSASFSTGIAKGSGQAGDWTAQGYGPAQNADGTNNRPTGFFGNFMAHFTDGHASGAYATRKD